MAGSQTPSNQWGLTKVTTNTYTVLVSDSQVNISGGSTSTVTLPLASAVPLGWTVRLGNANSGTCTLALSGSDTILPASATIATLISKGYASDGVSVWCQV